MPPKSGMTQAQKLEKILDYFYESATCHTLKDLEKSIPTATKVNKMQVKDLLQELTDTNQVKVEKIGSGNWYWAWAGEEVTEKENVVANLEYSPIAEDSNLVSDEHRAEEKSLNGSIQSMHLQLSQIKTEQVALQDNAQQNDILAELGPLEDEVKALSTEKDSWENAIAGGVEEKKTEIVRLKLEATESTNDIFVLESNLKMVAGLDRDGTNQLRMKCYGDIYVEGEELPDIDEI